MANRKDGSTMVYTRTPHLKVRGRILRQKNPGVSSSRLGLSHLRGAPPSLSLCLPSSSFLSSGPSPFFLISCLFASLRLLCSSCWLFLSEDGTSAQTTRRGLRSNGTLFFGRSCDNWIHPRARLCGRPLEDDRVDMGVQDTELNCVGVGRYSSLNPELYRAQQVTLLVLVLVRRGGVLDPWTKDVSQLQVGDRVAR
jgi:hypothetical protein